MSATLMRARCFPSLIKSNALFLHFLRPAAQCQGGFGVGVDRQCKIAARAVIIVGRRRASCGELQGHDEFSHRVHLLAVGVRHDVALAQSHLARRTAHRRQGEFRRRGGGVAAAAAACFLGLTNSSGCFLSCTGS